MTELTCHRLLLSLAGRLPEAVLAEMRIALAESPPRAAAMLAAVLATGQFPVTEDEWERVLTQSREAGGEGEDGGEGGDGDDQPWIVAELPEPAHGFSALRPGGGPSGEDACDLTAVRVAEAAAGRAVGLWRCWRGDGFGAEPDVRVYLVQVGSEAEAPAVAAALHRALRQEHPALADLVDVEAFAVDAEPGRYQRRALDAALLLWADGGSTGPEFMLARVFDRVDPETGPGFAGDHPHIVDAELSSRLLAYLASGRPVLSTTARMADPLDPAAGESVPLGFLTDGEWIWTEAVGYFLERHGLEPDPELLAHVRLLGFVPPQPDDETVLRASAFLLAPPDAADPDPAWTSERA
ncbi:hypothetical protein [Streptacidiphilus sp. EB129]|uniref:hypothetical protein n=1 Tax=Streptacidiphilus sp. EB129 TaxID=3156262 RepID=UPI00351903F6